jgi:serine/threonine protein kinase
MSGSGPHDKDSVTEVAEESFTRERAPDIERGSVLAGRYQVEEIIGKGGSGIVLRVFDRTAQNLVALKVLKDELARDSKWEKRFSRELRLGRPIQHPNVCRIFDIGEADGHRFLTMELAHGGSLREELKRTRSVDRPIEDRLADARAAIAGLAALHGAGVVHRDFKPDNLLRMEDGRLVLADFGLATDAANAPGATVLIGTPHYMAPEVLNGDPATSRSDVWALGVVLHEIFFGQRPERRSVSFDGSSRGPLRPQSQVERRMLALCETCLADSPLDRPSDARVVAQMFESARPVRRLGWRRKSTKIVTGLLLPLVLLGVGWRYVRMSARRTSEPAAPGNLPVVQQIQASGEPLDWSKSAAVVAEIPGFVHCFSLLDGKVARLVWGSPRRAEDIDLATGRRRPADWLPEVYRVGCPELSADGKALLYMARNAAGATEVRLSTSRDGGSASTLASGFDPTWLGGTDQFVYNADSSHTAIFSIPTMTSTFLSIPEYGQHQGEGSKAASADGGVIAELLYDDRGRGVVTVMTGPLFDEVVAFGVPMGSAIQFSPKGNDLLVSPPAIAGGTLMSVVQPWDGRRAINEGRYPGFDLSLIRAAGRDQFAVARRTDRDVWLNEASSSKRLTFDGTSYSAARSVDGTLLLGKRSADGILEIWRQRGNGPPEKVTNGPADVGPSFSPDGKQWAYADYSRKSIMLCSTESAKCRALVRDEFLPCWPKFSPDGRTIAYVTQLSRFQLLLVSAEDGRTRAAWDTHPECPPAWSSANTLWSLESSLGQYVWSERDTTGRRTGKRFTASSENLEPLEASCSPPPSSAGSRSLPDVEVRTVEASKLLVLHRL